MFEADAARHYSSDLAIDDIRLQDGPPLVGWIVAGRPVEIILCQKIWTEGKFISDQLLIEIKDFEQKKMKRWWEKINMCFILFFYKKQIFGLVGVHNRIFLFLYV